VVVRIFRIGVSWLPQILGATVVQPPSVGELTYTAGNKKHSFREGATTKYNTLVKDPYDWPFKELILAKVL